ncbi:LAMI_0D09384g1_1 [Lachancea mirantina]|uniref:LAMI_0D09384g1_1 n=1 Tax=Lachancea mirantina TaxID=1230905 RepID=A0A1G4JDR4_9SACH|nr:LAMI_0D09384g1_1 [Lachancea mirantina]
MSKKKNIPVRIAVLGGEETGKTSFISRLTVDLVHESHYPTREQNNWLFTFRPVSAVARAILDEEPHKRCRIENGRVDGPIFDSPDISDHILLPPLVFRSIIEEFSSDYKSNNQESKSLSPGNALYTYKENSNELLNVKSSSTNSDSNIMRSASQAQSKIWDESQILPLGSYMPPDYEPITIDVIDTPGFKPDMVVPFLEVSLFRKLDRDVLGRLADEPRLPVSTTSMLVASGASELNGKVAGYVYVYSAVPELNQGASPPGYESASLGDNVDTIIAEEPGKESRKRSVSSGDVAWSSFDRRRDGGLALLEVIRNCMLDAWAEFRDYQNRWSEGKEGDVYSLMYSLKQMWKSQSRRNEKLKQLRSYNRDPKEIDLDEASPNAPPPSIIICTHCNDHLASPVLIETGKRMAVDWRCGFVALDSSENYNVDVALSLLLREILEKEKIVQALKLTKRGGLKK